MQECDAMRERDTVASHGRDIAQRGDAMQECDAMRGSDAVQEREECERAQVTNRHRDLQEERGRSGVLQPAGLRPRGASVPCSRAGVSAGKSTSPERQTSRVDFPAPGAGNPHTAAEGSACGRLSGTYRRKPERSEMRGQDCRLSGRPSAVGGAPAPRGPGETLSRPTFGPTLPG